MTAAAIAQMPIRIGEVMGLQTLHDPLCRRLRGWMRHPRKVQAKHGDLTGLEVLPEHLPVGDFFMSERGVGQALTVKAPALPGMSWSPLSLEKPWHTVLIGAAAATAFTFSGRRLPAVSGTSSFLRINSTQSLPMWF